MQSETSELSHPLINTYILYKKLANSDTDTKLPLVIQSVCAGDLIVSNDYSAFLADLKTKGTCNHIGLYLIFNKMIRLLNSILGWNTETNLLTVGAWRFHGVSMETDENDSLLVVICKRDRDLFWKTILR